MAALRRKQEAGTDVPALDLEPLEWGAHLVGWLFEVGPGHDGKPIAWRDIEAWRNMTGTHVAPNEAIALRTLSAEYMAELHESRKPERVRPNADRTMENALNLKAALRKLTKA